jgi:hypothetical protein
MNNTPSFIIPNGKLKAFLLSQEKIDANGKSVFGTAENDVYDPISEQVIMEQPTPKAVSKAQLYRAMGVPAVNYSELKMSEYEMEKLRNPGFIPPRVVDLDTAEDMVEYYKVANANMLQAENEFSTTLKSQAELKQFLQ